MKINKKGFALMDSVIALILLSLMVMLFYSSIQMYTKYTTRSAAALYDGITLTECAEVVHSIRYGEWDKGGTVGWNSYIFNYPTGLYQMQFDNTTSVWDLIPIYLDSTNKTQYISFRDMLNQTGYTDDTKGENFTIGPKKIHMRRYVFLDNTIPNKSIVHCYVKYDNPYFSKKKSNNGNDIYSYEELKFIMTDYR